MGLNRKILMKNTIRAVGLLLVFGIAGLMGTHFLGSEQKSVTIVPPKLQTFNGNGVLHSPVLIKDNKLTVNVGSESVCHWGDLDLLKLELEGRDSKELLFTFEPLTIKPESEGFLLKKTSIDELRNGTSFTVSLPTVTGPGVWGLFLCTGSEESLCSSKPIADVQSLFESHFPAVDPSSFEASEYPENTPDRVYFYNVLAFRGEVFTGLTRAGLTDKSDELEGTLSKFGVSKSSVETVSAQIRELHNNLGSYPAKVSDGSVYINLPHASEKECSGR